MFERILIGVDFSECGERALDLARRQFPAAQRRLFHVQLATPPSVLDLMEPAQSSAAAGERARSRLELLRGGLETVGTGEGNPADALLDEAQSWGADLIVVGTHGRTGVQHLLFGSVAERVIRAAGVPVLTVGDLVARARGTERAPESEPAPALRAAPSPT